MFKVEPIKKITVTEQIMDQIAHMITSGKLQPGDKLPNERLLAEQFGVARGRVREALRALSLVGLITIKAGEGSFVTPHEQPIPADTISWLFHKEIHNLDEVYDARKLIESAVYLSAVLHADDAQLEQLDRMLQALKASAGHFHPEQFAQLLDQIDLYAGEICGNQIYFKLMQTNVYLRHDSIVKLLNVPGAPASSIQTRSVLFKALKSRDPAQMQAALDMYFHTAKSFYSSIIEA